MSTGVPNPTVTYVGTTRQTLIFAGDNGVADEGSYFTATTATPMTGVAQTTSVVDDAATQSSTHAQASPALYIANQNPAGSGINIYLRYIKCMLQSQVPTSATSWQYSFRYDNNTSKLTTAGTTLTPHNVNTGVTGANSSKALIQVGAITTVIMSSAGWLHSAGIITGAIPVVFDQYNFVFGDNANAMSAIGTQTLVKALTIQVAPIVIAPGYQLTMGQWGASNGAAPAFSWEIGYVERPTGQ